MYPDASTAASVYLGDFDEVRVPAPHQEKAGRVVDYDVSHSRSPEQKTSKAIVKALSDIDADMGIAAWFLTQEASPAVQNRLFELIMECIAGWSDIADTNVVDPKRDKNFNTIMKAARVRDAMRTAGFWEYDEE